MDASDENGFLTGAGRDRALMLGLLLGDAYDELAAGTPGRVHGTCASQLACFTLEGLIRAAERATHKGICHLPTVVWHAWCRWAHLQGLGPQFAARWGTSGSWPDGWLSQVAPMGQRRGSAPATVAALTASADLPHGVRTSSAGHHAVTSTLPVAVIAATLPDPAQGARDLAVLTHGHRAAGDAAAAAVNYAVALLRGEPAVLRVGPDDASAAYGPGTAWHALAHGAQAAASTDDLREALARAGAHGRGAATVAGALFGARCGVAALPADLVGALELGWVAERLVFAARVEAADWGATRALRGTIDPTWFTQYPGW